MVLPEVRKQWPYNVSIAEHSSELESSMHHWRHFVAIFLNRHFIITSAHALTDSHQQPDTDTDDYW